MVSKYLDLSPRVCLHHEVCLSLLYRCIYMESQTKASDAEAILFLQAFLYSQKQSKQSTRENSQILLLVPRF